MTRLSASSTSADPLLIIDLPITGMSCTSCAGRVEKALQKIDGVTEAVVNLANESARVTHEKTVTTAMLVTAIEQAGYHVAHESVNLSIGGMSCASCAARVEKALLTHPNVLQATVNLATETARIDILKNHSDLSPLIKTLSTAGYSATPQQSQLPTDKSAHHEALAVMIAAALSLPLVVPMLLQPFGIHWMLSGWWQLLLCAPVQFILGGRFYAAAWRAIKARTGNMDLLVALGTSAAFFLSVYQLFTQRDNAMVHYYFEASAVVITLVLLGKWLEAKAKRQTVAAIRALQALRPLTARVKRNSQELDIAIEQIVLNDVVIVRPGERIPVDGIIIEGSTHIDESMLTGESLPVAKTINDKVIAGSINSDGVLLIKTLAIGADTALSRIIQLVENAQAAKAPIQRLVDQVSAIFVPTVLVIALITFIGWFFYNGEIQQAIMNAVAVLVIACPCALGLATPTAIMVGTGVAAQHGILIKDAEALEMAYRINTVVFDKTGTLTVGKPTLLEALAVDNHHADFLHLAAAIQAHSEHPLARAVVIAAKDKINSAQEFTAENIQALAGRGIAATIDQRQFYLGSTRLMQEKHIDLTALSERANQLAAQGQTISWLSDDKKLLGLLAFGDQIKPTAHAAIQQLHTLGIRTVMISGDNQGSAKRVAEQLNIDEFFAEVLPAEKAAAIASMKQQKNIVAMVGDGINDAPALATADVGIAMATGTDVAMHTAGITLMHGDPALVAQAMDISRRTYKKIQQNLFWAFIYNIVGIPLAAAGLLNPVIAGAMMAFSSVSVVSNALLLKRWKPSSTL
jgi:Cu+-exporting ATPase